jgi:hypothetical protein
VAYAPNILERFAEDLAKAGLTGENRAAKLLYLAVTSRVLARPVSIALKGPSSAGKSHTVGSVLKFFPEAAAYSLTGMSNMAIAYSQEPLAHRFLVVYEAAGMKGEFATYGIRSLLSEQCIKYETVEKATGGEAFKTRLVYRPGPTGLITTTTMLSLHPENETRLISVGINDTADQTRAVMLAIAEAGEQYVDYEPWHALQSWIACSGNSTLIPYATQLAHRIPPVATRLRRDFHSLLNLVRAHAVLHRATREVNERGAIVATLADYAAVRELTADLFSEGVKASISREVRETVEAVAANTPANEPLMLLEDRQGVSLTTLKDVLQLDKATVSRRVEQAQRDHYLINLEERAGRPARLVLGEPLPDNVEVLPPPEALMT